MALKYKVGDKVRIKGTDIGGIIKEIKRGQYVVQISHSSQIMVAWPEDLSLIEGLMEDVNISEFKYAQDEIMKMLLQGAINVPEGYEFQDENGNIIEAKVITLEKKKKEYPKTCDECLEVLGYTKDALLSNKQNLYSYSVNLLADFQKLLICRDAYWKIAGKEMRLGKPWELSIGIPIYYIYYNRTLGTIKKDYADDIQGNVILAFPTEEMRDAFYENFKELIKICKELL